MDATAVRDTDPRLWTEEQVVERIRELKAHFGRELCILAHHYQRDANVAVADHVGDSLGLSQAAAASSARAIVFCGVHFMAETADILTGPDQVVILPDARAGCSMADMADPETLEWAFEQLAAVAAGPVVPVTYVNSTAALKAFVGRHGGVVCTSANARAIVGWALDRGGKVLFLPDEHLGRVTAFELGVPLESMLVWDREATLGGHAPQAVRQARVYLWNGCCVVHQMFELGDIEEWRRKEPDIKVIVHPECALPVVRAADLHGSTSRIVREIEASPPGSKWAVGTELSLVARLAARHPDKLVVSLATCQAICANMYRTRPLAVLRVLEALAAGRVVNRVRVAPQVAAEARLALDRMLALS